MNYNKRCKAMLNTEKYELVVGYGVICNSYINKRDRDKFDKENTNVYRKTKKLLKQIGFPNADIYIDIVHSHNREKPEFEKMYNLVSENTLIVTFSISFLGEGEELAENYAGLVGSAPLKCADILIPNIDGQGVSKFSTVDMNLNSRRNKMNFASLVQELESTKQKPYMNLRGRAGYEITEDFINAYWLYERFKISIEKACEMANLGQTKFYAFLKQYESSSEYLERLKVEEQKYQISKKPKRYGKIPKGFVGVIALVDKGASLESACIQSGIQPINPIDYERYKLKYFGGRKALAKAMEY